jgi:pteridine reductase
MERSLENKVVLVTGAGIRVGRAIAEGLGAAGADVALHCHHSQEGAREVQKALQAQGLRAEVFPADLGDAAQIEPMVERVEKTLGPLSAVVNNAAIFQKERFVDTPLQMLDDQWRLNARAPFLVAQACARRMLERGQGDIVNIIDVGGAFRPWRGYSAYGMTKAALKSLTECLAIELAPTIRVNAVAPGTVLVPEGYDEAARANLAARTPAKRLGSPQDVFEAVLFLLTGPRYMTGQMLTVDGGGHLSSTR